MIPSESVMTLCFISAVAFLASGLTFFSGFGLGTVLLPAFAIFFPVEQAVALTAIVHFLNNLFKLALVGRQADRQIVLRFGIPAVVASILGAMFLLWLVVRNPWFTYSLFDHQFAVTPVKFTVGCLLLFFSSFEMIPRLRDLQFNPRFLPLGGLLSGFFGGLAGTQGALRTAFLVRSNLSKESFIATGVVVACMVDVSRLAFYSRSIPQKDYGFDYSILVAAILSAFLGTLLGNRYLKKMTMKQVQAIVAILLFAIALGLMSGLL